MSLGCHYSDTDTIVTPPLPVGAMLQPLAQAVQTSVNDCIKVCALPDELSDCGMSLTYQGLVRFKVSFNMTGVPQLLLEDTGERQHGGLPGFHNKVTPAYWKLLQYTGATAPGQRVCEHLFNRPGVHCVRGHGGAASDRGRGPVHTQGAEPGIGTRRLPLPKHGCTSCPPGPAQPSASFGAEDKQHLHFRPHRLITRCSCSQQTSVHCFTSLHIECNILHKPGRESAATRLQTCSSSRI